MSNNLPDVNLNILDGGLGLLPSTGARTQIKFGISPLGPVNVVKSVGDLGSLFTAFGRGGDLVESIALALAKGGPVLGVAVNPSTYGSVGTVTKTAASAASNSALGITAIPASLIKVRISTGGSPGTAQAVVSTDNGLTWSAPSVISGAWMIPSAPLITLQVGGTTFAVGDTWLISQLDGSVNPVVTGTGTLTLNSASPIDSFAVGVTLTLSGALGTAQFTYTLDGGNTVVGPLTVPSSGKFAPADTGLLFTFSGSTFVAGDSWNCTVTGPSFNTTDLTNAWNAAVADPRAWGFAHIVGPASSSSGAAAVVALLDGLLGAAASVYRFTRALVEFPNDADATVISALASVATTRAGGCGGFAYITSPINGRSQFRSVGRLVAARVNQVPVSEDLGKVATGPVSGVSLKPVNQALPAGRDEFSTPGLDAARLCTLRSIIGIPGVYVTAGRLLATPGSDFTFLQNGRVMDVACDTVRAALLPFLNSSLRVNQDGTIFDVDAVAIESKCKGALNDALVSPGDASSASVVIPRTQNILSTSLLVASIRVVPLGYARGINADIGFQNPTTLTAK